MSGNPRKKVSPLKSIADRSGVVRKADALYGRMRREFGDEELIAPWAEKIADVAKDADSVDVP